MACGELATDPTSEATAVPGSEASSAAIECGIQSNNTTRKLADCVTLDGVQAHLVALQSIADANGGMRAAGTPGYDESAAYVSGLLSQAGYAVTVQTFQFRDFRELGASTLEQVTPTPTTYVQGSDFDILGYSGAADITANVIPVDLDLGSGNSSTSGCESADFAGFPVGTIALLQRGGCEFIVKVENAEAAGAVGVIIFNQGNTIDRLDIFKGSLTAAYTGGLPAMTATYDLGITLSVQASVTVRMATNVSTTVTQTSNVLAETRDGDAGNVVMVGGHLDSVRDGPGINDNGSSSAALLEVALQMALVKPRNKVRFAWWGAEEVGLIGSTQYLAGLSSAQRAAIALYLNFDMIASPNFVYFVYDPQDGNGSTAITKFFQDFYAGRSLPSELAPMPGGSDHTAFSAYGIPIGGVFTGADGVKTDEQAALYGGLSGIEYDPCYHLACDTYNNLSLAALDVNADAIASAVIQFAMSTETVNGKKGKGNFRVRVSPSTTSFAIDGLVVR